MKNFKILILTDHTNHSKENSLYALARTLVQHQDVKEVLVATRADEKNLLFFKYRESEPVSYTHLTLPTKA